MMKAADLTQRMKPPLLLKNFKVLMAKKTKSISQKAFHSSKVNKDTGRRQKNGPNRQQLASDLQGEYSISSLITNVFHLCIKLCYIRRD